MQNWKRLLVQRLFLLGLGLCLPLPFARGQQVIPREQDLRQADAVDARRYGVVADDGLADDAALALARAATPAGGTLRLPKGTLNLASSWALTTGSITIEGSPQGTTLKPLAAFWTTATNSSILRFTGTSGTHLTNIKVRNLTFDASTWSDGTQGIVSGLLQAGATKNTVVLSNSASATDDYYNGSNFILLADGTNSFASYQDFSITDYVGATRTATLSPNFRAYSVNPTAVTSGTPATFTLPTTYTGVTQGRMVGAKVEVTAGTGSGATVYTITAFDEGTRVATLDIAWAGATPTTSSTIAIYYGIPATGAKYGIQLGPATGNNQAYEGNGRLNFIYCDDLTIENCSWIGGHGALDLRKCKRVTVNNIQATNVYENVVNMLSTPSSDNAYITVSNFVFTNVGQGFDLAGTHFTIGNGTMTLAGAEADAFDLNASIDFVISNVEVSSASTTLGYQHVFSIHGNAAAASDCTYNGRISNVAARDFEYLGVAFEYSGSNDANRDALNGTVGNLTWDNCSFVSTKPGARGLLLSSYSLSTTMFIDDVRFNNCRIQVPGVAVRADVNRRLTMRDCEIWSTYERGFYATSGTFGGDFMRPTDIRLIGCDLKGMDISTTGGPVQILGGVRPLIDGCTLTGVGEGYAAFLRNCQSPTVRNNRFITSVRGGVYIQYDTSVATYIGADNHLNVVVSNNIFEDFGTTGNRYAVYVHVSATSGTYSNVWIEDNKAWLLADSGSHALFRIQPTSAGIFTFLFVRRNVATSHFTGTITTILDWQGAAATNFQHPVIVSDNTPQFGVNFTQPLTANYTVTKFMAGGAWSNLGAAAAVTVSLPPAKAGDGPFTFYVQAAQSFRLDPSGSEILYNPTGTASTGAGQYMASSTVGDYVRIYSLKDGEWISEGRGTYTFAP